MESRRKLSSVYRVSALRAISGFRTISEDAECVIAGLIPIDILAMELKKVYLAKRNDADNFKHARISAREESMNSWQRQWDNSRSGRWTFSLIPDIRAWVGRKYGAVNYELTQFLSGHGGYRKYLYKFKQDEPPCCPMCGKEEDARHAIFECPRFRSAQNIAHDPPSLMVQMTESEEKWQEVSAYIAEVHKELRKAERRRKADRTTGELA